MQMQMTPRFDSRAKTDMSRGRTQSRVAKRAVTTIALGSKAVLNKEMRAIFKGVQ